MFESDAFSVLAATVIHFGVWASWCVLFGRQDSCLWKLNEESCQTKDPKPFIIGFMGALWSSYGLFLLIDKFKPKEFSDLLALAVAVWLFIIVGFSCKHVAREAKPVNAILKEYTVDLVAIILMSLVIWL